jgi:murein L,D-transpeptidase YcbB/YkuD
MFFYLYTNNYAMRKHVLSIAVILFGFTIAATNRPKIENLTEIEIHCAPILRETTAKNTVTPISSSSIDLFFKKYPNLKKYQSDVSTLYKKRNYKSIWITDKGFIEFAILLYAKVNLIEEEGVKATLAYKDKIDAIFNEESVAKISPADKEMLLSAMYIFYAKNVFYGIDSKKIQDTGWLWPRKNISYSNLLDSFLEKPKLLDKNEQQQFEQYYRLRDALAKYRQIKQSGDWSPIETDSLLKEYNLGVRSKTIAQIRHRLVVIGDLKQDSKNDLYDEELLAGILNFKKRNGYKPDPVIGSQHINRMNIPIDSYIKIIMANMERCRWVTPDLSKSDEYIMINIPSFNLVFKRMGENVLESKVYIGINTQETVIFSSIISQIVFSPYWYVPQSIIENEMKEIMAKDPNYMVLHDLEYNNGMLRQKPGKKNSLGLVKFVFPNPYSIYLHDTPHKQRFDADMLLFSHGCVNMERAKELAFSILEYDPEWPVGRIEEAMLGVKETPCVLKKKIPIYIGYFTAWGSDSGEINFYFDIYQRDGQLIELLFLDSK